MAETTQEKSRHEILAELWGMTVEEAKARDEQRRAQVAAEFAAVTEGAQAPAAPPVKKTGVADNQKS